MSEEIDSQEKAKLLKVKEYKKHVFLCLGPECTDAGTGERVWNHLKKKLSDLKVSAPGGTGEVFRTKAACLRICSSGPIALVYPGGVWYKNVDESVMDRIVEEHLICGKIVEENVLCENEAMLKE